MFAAAALAALRSAGAVTVSAAPVIELTRITETYCVDMGLYVEGFFPVSMGDVQPPPSVVEAILDELLGTGLVHCIMVYSSQGSSALAVAAAAQRGVPVLQLLNIEGIDAEADATEISAGIALIEQYPTTIVGVLCGNEVWLETGSEQLYGGELAHKPQ
jgi:hypothetical protein